MPELSTDRITAVLSGRLGFGVGSVGARCVHETPEQIDQLREDIKPHLGPVNVVNAIDCVEDRPFLIMAGSELVLATDRVAEQLPGGTILAFTKAASAADAAYLRNAKTLWQAFLKTEQMARAAGLADSWHENCGAESVVKGSNLNPLPLDTVEPAANKLIPGLQIDRRLFRLNAHHVADLLGSGYYDEFDSGQRADMVAHYSPGNLAYLPKQDADSCVSHGARGLVIINRPGIGLAKTALHQASGQMVFGMTPGSSVFDQMVERFGGSPEEKARIRLEGLITDPLNVFNCLAARGLSLYGLTP